MNDLTLGQKRVLNLISNSKLTKGKKCRCGNKLDTSNVFLCSKCKELKGIKSKNA